MKSYKSHRSFQHCDFTGQTTDSDCEFISTLKKYCKLNNFDAQNMLLTFKMCLSGAAKCWSNGLSADTKQDLKLNLIKSFCRITSGYKQLGWKAKNQRLQSQLTKTIADMSDLDRLVGITNSELSKALIRSLPRQFVQ